ncbi:MAG: hypothetical protein QOC71_963 [Thermoplasmata archaeon]|nr:hypothetical protein [Thermoplasmata archaeon]
MKTTLILTSLLTLGALAIAPTGQAAPADAEKCYTVYDFPDLGWRVCYNLEDSQCTIYEYRTTIIGTEKSCIYPSGEASSQSSAGGIPWPGGQTPDVQCMDNYSETYLFGQYWLVRRDSCSAQIYECPDGYDPPAAPCHEAEFFTSASASGGIPWPGGQTPDVQCMDNYSQTYLFGPYWLVRRDSCSAQLYECPEGYSPPAPPCHEASLVQANAAGCYMVYSRTNVGHYSVVRRTSCSPPEVYSCPYEGAPIDRCQPLLSTIVTSSAAPQSEPNCLDYYSEWSVGPLTHVSRDSCHSENYLCEDDDGVHESDETVGAYINRQLANPGPAETQQCVEDYVGRYVAFG